LNRGYPDLANRAKASYFNSIWAKKKPRDHLWEYNAELFDIKELERTKMRRRRLKSCD
jgi:hypothetical protein